MKRFIDISKQLDVWNDTESPDYVYQFPTFCFYDTVRDEIETFNDRNNWSSWEEFLYDFDGADFLLERYKGLCPDWVFNERV